MSLPPLFAVVGIVLTLGPLALAQAEARPDDPVIRVSVNLVQVDAVVTDSQGRHVEDLKPEDFEIFENGKQKTITAFSEVKAPPALPKTSEPNFARVRPLRPGDVRRTIVLLADNFTMAFENTAFVRQAMKKFVDEQMRPGDLVAIMTTGGGAGIFQQFTNDRRQLYASIDRIVWAPSFAGSFGGRDPVARTLETAVPSAQRGLMSFRPDAIALNLFGTLNYAILSLRDLPGRKAIALFSDGFQVVQKDSSLAALDAVQRTIERANRSAVVIYSIDSRGLENFAPGDFAYHMGKYESNDMLAKGTGGLSFHENNGLAEELKASLDDLSGYYLLGYRPEREYFEKVHGLPQFHNIQIKLTRPGLRVRSRKGFFGVPEPAPQPPFKTRHEQLRAALFSPFRAEMVPVQLSAVYSPGMARNAKTRHRPAAVRTMLAVDARALTFEDTPGRKKRLVLDAVTAAYDAGSDLVASSDKTFTLEVTAEEAGRLMTSGLVYGMEMELAKPGAYQVRTVVRDVASGRLGSAAEFIQIPDFDRDAIALTSVRLWDADAKRNEELEKRGVMGAGSEATRVFAPGAVLNYSFEIYGARADKRSGKRDVEIEVRLFHGPERFFNGNAIALSGTDFAVVPAHGEIRLPAEIPPGDYSAEILVYDRLRGGKERPTQQWVDFSIASAS